MTRTEFREEINSWDELITFCNDAGLNACEDVYDDGAYDDMVEEDISERDWGWERLRDCLSDLPESRWNEFYYRDGWLDYRVLDEDDFDAWKSSAEDEMDNWGGFDEEDEDEDEEGEEVEEEEAPVEDEDEIDENFDPSQIFDGCQSIFQRIDQDTQHKRLEELSAQQKEERAEVEAFEVSLSGIVLV